MSKNTSTSAWINVLQSMANSNSQLINNYSASQVFGSLPKKTNGLRQTGWPTIRATYKTGSRHTCNPPVMDTDDDTLVLVDRLPDKQFMKENGWEFCGSEEYSSSFEAYRSGDRNLTLITDESIYIRRCAATELCKAMNLKEKADRIAIWEVVTGYEDRDAPIPGEGGLL